MIELMLLSSCDEVKDVVYRASLTKRKVEEQKNKNALPESNGNEKWI